MIPKKPMTPATMPREEAQQIVNDMMTPISAAVTTPAGNQPGQRLTIPEVYTLARNAGFPPDMARRMVAIAMRESGLNPAAVCKDCVPGVKEYSLGLWQLNMSGQLGKNRLKLFGIEKPEQLLDPAVNARAAFITWAGKEDNLRIAWAMGVEGPLAYTSKYEANLRTIEAMHGNQIELVYQAKWKDGQNA